MPRLGRTRRVRKASTMARAGGTTLYQSTSEPAFEARPSTAAKPQMAVKTAIAPMSLAYLAAFKWIPGTASSIGGLVTRWHHQVTVTGIVPDRSCKSRPKIDLPAISPGRSRASRQSVPGGRHMPAEGQRWPAIIGHVASTGEPDRPGGSRSPRADASKICVFSTDIKVLSLQFAEIVLDSFPTVRWTVCGDVVGVLCLECKG